MGTRTGRAACALQAALRMSNEAFAEHLGIAVRTVAAWQAGDRVSVEGALRRRFYRSGDGSATRLEIEVLKASRVARA